MQRVHRGPENDLPGYPTRRLVLVGGALAAASPLLTACHPIFGNPTQPSDPLTDALPVDGSPLLGGDLVADPDAGKLSQRIIEQRKRVALGLADLVLRGSKHPRQLASGYSVLPVLYTYNADGGLNNQRYGVTTDQARLVGAQAWTTAAEFIPESGDKPLVLDTVFGVAQPVAPTAIPDIAGNIIMLQRLLTGGRKPKKAGEFWSIASSSASNENERLSGWPQVAVTPATTMPELQAVATADAELFDLLQANTPVLQ
ncbi:MAG TPA: hypothetical protein VLF69_05225 [Candidatus Saccharimonadales bacterium]|nr:hypothetical protein [Candidatus Saccharimonadales bacterium]